MMAGLKWFSAVKAIRKLGKSSSANSDTNVYGENRRKEFDMLQAFRIADGVLFRTGSSHPRDRVQLDNPPRANQYLLRGDHIFALPPFIFHPPTTTIEVFSLSTLRWLYTLDFTQSIPRGISRTRDFGLSDDGSLLVQSLASQDGGRAMFLIMDAVTRKVRLCSSPNKPGLMVFRRGVDQKDTEAVFVRLPALELHM
jgi:hypothetical protein